MVVVNARFCEQNLYLALLEVAVQWALSLLSAGGVVDGQMDEWARFAVIEYDNPREEFVYFARQWNHVASSYICQLQQQGLSKYHDSAIYISSQILEKYRT